MFQISDLGTALRLDTRLSVFIPFIWSISYPFGILPIQASYTNLCI